MELWKLHSKLFTKLVEQGYTKSKALRVSNQECGDMVKKGEPTPLMRMAFGRSFSDYGLPPKDAELFASELANEK